MTISVTDYSTFQAVLAKQKFFNRKVGCFSPRASCVDRGEMPENPVPPRPEGKRGMAV